MDARTRSALIKQAESLVKQHMQAYDPSHDWFHVDRVRNTALRLSRDLQASGHMIDDLLVELVALFHDMAAKYTNASSLSETLSPFLSSPLTTKHLTTSQANDILHLIPYISWSTEKKLRQSGEWDRIEEQLKAEGKWDVLCCVQDADRLDAIGAFGILRVAAYSSAVNRPLHVPASNPERDQDLNAEEAVELETLRKGSSIQHFYDKLLLIKDRLKTDMGKREGEKRHQTMVDFLAAISKESDDHH
ncbi:hypothetical protein FFLO_03641 [Filobasidium floriforme]|uniref:HD/PDEase domain-containing protein n=1 Tax=Filobasidium floriforme TaxID=5210 RepID=A0A8K0JKD1_9TREE|nr:hypothetical protein FFLO_03641 [Filobasidium floriforme]